MRPFKIKASYEVEFSPDGTRLVSLGRDVNLWSVRERRKIWRVHPFSHPSMAAFSADGAQIAVKNTAGQIVLLHADTGKVLVDFKNQAEGDGSNVVFSPCGEQLIDGSGNGAIVARSLQHGKILFKQEYRGQMISRIHLSSNGDFLLSEHHPVATVSDKPPADCFFQKWSFPLKGHLPKRLPIELPFIASSALSACATQLVVVYGAPPVEMVCIDLDSGSILWRQAVNLGGSGNAVRWSPCNRLIGSVQKHCISIYRSHDGMMLTRYPLIYPSDVAFSFDSQFIALGSWKEGVVAPFDPYQKNHDGEQGGSYG